MNHIETFEQAVTRLQTVFNHIDKLPEAQQELDARAEVLNRYQLLFAREHIPELTSAEFYSFLLFENNQHWTGLQRHGSRMTEDMTRLRNALDLLLYGEEDIGQRFETSIAMVTGMGRAVASALLLVRYPDRYGVWNSTSEAGLKRLGLWPDFDRGTRLGERYVAINDVLRQLSRALDKSLWTLDVLLWSIDSPAIFEQPREPIGEAAFGLERHLQAFLWDNWGACSLGKEWELYTEEGDPEAGYEYPCDVGRIDLLAKHRSDPRWLVIELKRGQTGDATLGQVLRYMGWIREHLAQANESVEGLIIAREPEPGLRYALRMVPSVSYQRYEVHFSLHSIEAGLEMEA